MNEQIKQMRQSNIELLRIITMCLIIAHHTVLHGGAINIDFCKNKWISILLYPGGKIGYVTFIVISMYFLVDKQFKMERLLKVWLETLFYSVVFLFVASHIGGLELTITDYVSVFLPITGNVHGYAATYILVYAITPFLAIVAKKINKQQMLFIITALVIPNVLYWLVYNYTNHTQKINSNVSLFVMIYFICYYIKKYSPKWTRKKLTLIILFIVSWVGVCCIYSFHVLYPENKFFTWLLAVSNSQTSIIMLIGGFVLFFFFLNIKMKNRKWLNTLASSTLAILMIHDHNYFRKVLWNDVIHTQDWMYSRLFLIRVFITVISIYLICTVIDILRRCLLEKWIFNLKFIKKLCNKVDCIVNGEQVCN